MSTYPIRIRRVHRGRRHPRTLHITYWSAIAYVRAPSRAIFSFFFDRPLEPPVALTTGARAPLFRGFFGVTTTTVYFAYFVRCLVYALCRKRCAAAKTIEMCENYCDVFFSFPGFWGRSRAFVLFGSWPIEKETYAESKIIIIRVKENR